MHSSMTSFTHCSRVPSLSERGILSTPLNLSIDCVELIGDRERGFRVAVAFPQELLVGDQFFHRHFADVPKRHKARTPHAAHDDRHHHTFMARFFEFAIRSGSAPVLRLCCSTSKPLPYFSLVSRPRAMAASRVWFAACQLLGKTLP